jgi:hypothetical protein
MNSNQYSPFSEAKSDILKTEIYVLFFVPEHSSLSSKQPATCPYPRPDKSNAPTPILFL